MRIIVLTVRIIVVVSAAVAGVGATTLTVERGSNLQAVIDYARDGDTLMLGLKEFRAIPAAMTDSLCGNCGDPLTAVQASYGFIVRGKALVIIGKDRSGTQVVTNAGYGVYFEDAAGSELRNLTITGGKRDDDGNATDAGVVVRRSSVRIVNCDIRDNTGRASDTNVVVGIGGVFGREGAEITVRGCRIVNNGWDGVALYRGASAVITDCLIADGRGVGIGVTWDATCVAFRNEITGYWKGLGSFGTASVVARNNLIRDCLGWGLIATGQSTMEATNNVIVHNGNCGFAPWSIDARGRFINNIVVDNGWRDKWVCPCVGVWNYGDWAKWIFRNNIVWHNQAGEYEDIWIQTGINGNVSIDPLFIGSGETADGPSEQSIRAYLLRPNSPARNAGDSTIYNVDGSVSDIGLTGGPAARP